MQPQDDQHFWWIAIAGLAGAVMVSIIGDDLSGAGAMLGGRIGHFIYTTRRDAREARLADATRCPECGYPTEGLVPGARCPECGRAHPAGGEDNPARSL